MSIHTHTQTQHFEQSIIQVTWLVVTEVWSERFRLVIQCRHYNGRYMLWCVFIVECGITCFLCTMCVFEVRASSTSPKLPLCQILFLFWASPQRIIVYSVNHLLTQLICCSGYRSFCVGIWKAQQPLLNLALVGYKRKNSASKMSPQHYILQKCS